MRVAISGWFSGQPVGSGQYTDCLLQALQVTAGPGERFVLIPRPGPAADQRRREQSPPSSPGPGPSPSGIRSALLNGFLRLLPPQLTKLLFEQLFPQYAGTAQLVHVPYWGPPLYSPVPVVVTVHDLIPLLLPAYRRRWAVRIYCRLAARATRRAAAIIADSRHTAADIRRHLEVDPSRVWVIPLAVADDYRPQADTAAVRAAYDLPPRYGLYLGGFDVRKDLATLLAAWRAVHATTGVPLVIAGRLPRPGDRLSPHPAVLARQLDLPPEAFRTIGFVSEADKPGLYAGAAVFAYPSRYEGFGLPPLEALACGTPAVVADATSLPEVVGSAALKVPPGDTGAWAEALGAVLGDPALAARLAAAGPEQAARFTWRRTAAETRTVYLGVGR